MEYGVNTRSVPTIFGDGWLVRIEKAAFGWVRKGSWDEETEEVWDETKMKGEINLDTGAYSSTSETTRKKR